MSVDPVVLLLGRRDHPTDGVADYCEKLREHGAARGLAFETAQVRWAEKGWSAAFTEVREAASAWRDRWVFLQYTTLAWSRRGFPLRAPRVLEILRQCGARPGVVLHDFAPQTGSGIVAGIREMCQLRVLRQLYERSDLAIFTIPANNISWLPTRRDKAVFIPVGPNCPDFPASVRIADDGAKTIAVYGVTGGSRMLSEVADIAFAVKQAAAAGHALRLLVFGRGSGEAESALRSELAGTNVEIELLGLIPPGEVPRAFARADVLLFVRGHISSRRGSAIAGIAGGLPVVCYSGPDTDWPVTEAGILSAPQGDRQALAAALENVLSDASLREALANRSRQAHENYFSWTAITARFAAEIGPGTCRETDCVSAA